MKKLIFSTIEKFIKGVDTYNNNGSVWLIFTDEKKWVIELTKEGTLWYNYYFFQDIFKYFSLDVVENQRYITEWFELFIQNGVKHTDWCQIGTSTSIEDAIQNGVKHIQWWTNQRKNPIEDTIQNGVKETRWLEVGKTPDVEDAIQNGVKETKHNLWDGGLAMEEAIQNGVKEIKEVSDDSLWIEFFKVKCKQTIRDGVKRTELGGKDRKIDEIKDIVENGIKETNLEEHHRLREVVQTVKNGIKETTPGGYLGSVEMKGKKVHQFESPKQNNEVEDVIENKVKETSPHFLEILNPINFEPVIKEMKRMNEVNIVLEDGIKEVRPLPSQEGNKDWGDYYYRQADRNKAHIKYVDDAITNGIKKTKAMDEWVNTDRIIDGVIRDGIKETKYCELHSLMRADHIIRDGINQTNWRKVDNHPTFIDKIIEKTNPF